MIAVKKNDQRFYTILVFLTLFFILVAFFGLPFFVGDFSYTILVSYIVVYLLITLIALYKERDNIFNIKVLFGGIYTIMIGISPICYYLKSKSFISNMGNDIMYQFIWIIIGYIGLIAGLSCKKRKGNVQTQMSESELKYSYFVSFILLALSLLTNLIFIGINFNVYSSGNLLDNTLSLIAGNGLLVQLMGLYSIGFPMMFNYCYITKKKYGTFWLFSIAMLPLLILKGGRTGIVLVLISILLIINSHKRISVKNILKFTLVLMLVIPSLGILKGKMSGVSTVNGGIASEFSVGSINLNYIKNTFPQNVEYQKGKTFLINLKMLLPGPDIDFTMWLKQSIGITFSGGGVTPTLLGEGYINYGMFGIVAFSIIAGLIASLLDYKYNYDKKNIVWTVCLIARLTDIFRGGFANSSLGVIILFVEFLIYKVIYSIKIHQ